MELYGAYLRVFLALPLVIFLLFLFFRLLQGRLSSCGSSGLTVQVRERVLVGGKAFLYVIKIGEEFFLFAGNGSELKLIKQLPSKLYLEKEEALKRDPPERPTFANILSKLQEQRLNKIIPWRQRKKNRRKQKKEEERS